MKTRREEDTIMDRWFQKLFASRVWRSIFRHGLPETKRLQSQVMTSSVFLHLMSVKVREKTLRFSYTYYLGGLAFGLFLILTATGILLMLYYRPSVPQAYQDMKDLGYVVSSGMFWRNLHRWAAHAMVLIVFLHMLRVFYTGAYKPPREFNWVIGVVLFILTLLLSYTGYLLPWDQLAFWGVSVGTNMVRATPLMGEKIRFLLLGGNTVGPNALIRFYVLHCVILPVFAILFIAMHLWRIRKDGGLADQPERPGAGLVNQSMERGPSRDVSVQEAGPLQPAVKE